MTRKVCVVFALTLMVVASIGGVAFAGAKKSAKANIQGGNAECGANQSGDPVLGTISYKRKGTTVTVKVTLKHGTPNANYGVDLYGNGCTGISSLGTLFATNSKGVGKTSGSFTVPAEDTQFFGAVYEESAPGVFGPSSDTPYVTLAP